MGISYQVKRKRRLQRFSQFLLKILQFLTHQKTPLEEKRDNDVFHSIYAIRINTVSPHQTV